MNPFQITINDLKSEIQASDRAIDNYLKKQHIVTVDGNETIWATLSMDLRMSLQVFYVC
jgi:hypothetical protein